VKFNLYGLFLLNLSLMCDIPNIYKDVFCKYIMSKKGIVVFIFMILLISSVSAITFSDWFKQTFTKQADASKESINGQDSISIHNITIISPNGGEELMEGKEYSIKWDSEGDIDYVNIFIDSYYDDSDSVNCPPGSDYCEPSGGAVSTRIVSASPNDGEYTWTIPKDTFTNNYIHKISIINANDPSEPDEKLKVIRDSSDDYFKIIPIPEPEEGYAGLYVTSVDSKTLSSVESSVRIIGPMELSSYDRKVLDAETPASFLSLDEGRYQMTINKTRYAKYVDNYVRVKNGETKSVDVELAELRNEAVFIFQTGSGGGFKISRDVCYNKESCSPDCEINYDDGTEFECVFSGISSKINKKFTAYSPTNDKYLKQMEIQMTPGQGIDFYPSDSNIVNPEIISVSFSTKEAEDIQPEIQPTKISDAEAFTKGKRVILTWKKVRRASTYKYERYNADGSFDAGPAKRSASLPRRVSSRRVPAGSYFYKIYALNNKGRVISTAESNIITVPASAKASISGKKVTLSWTKVNGAESYEYERYEKGEGFDAGPAKRSASLPTSVSSSRVPAGNYFYKVYALDGRGKIISSARSNVVTVPY